LGMRLAEMTVLIGSYLERRTGVGNLKGKNEKLVEFPLTHTRTLLVISRFRVKYSYQSFWQSSLDKMMRCCSPLFVDTVTRDRCASLDLKGGLTPVCTKRRLRRDSVPRPGRCASSTSQTLSNYFLCLTLRSNRFDG
jgi:hypothetical protein